MARPGQSSKNNHRADLAKHKQLRFCRPHADADALSALVLLLLQLLLLLRDLSSPPWLTEFRHMAQCFAFSAVSYFT